MEVENYGIWFLKGTGITLLIAITGTAIGFLIAVVLMDSFLLQASKVITPAAAMSNIAKVVRSLIFVAIFKILNVKKLLNLIKC